jgi:hypothetical protein
LYSPDRTKIARPLDRNQIVESVWHETQTVPGISIGTSATVLHGALTLNEEAQHRPKSA